MHRIGRIVPFLILLTKKLPEYLEDMPKSTTFALELRKHRGVEQW